MVRLRGQMICMTEAERAALLTHLAAHAAMTRAAPGCLTCDISETDDPMVFEVMEAFRDRATFDAQQARARDSAWFAATRGILRNFRMEDIGD